MAEERPTPETPHIEDVVEASPHDERVAELIEHTIDVPVLAEAVAYSLLARHYKRVSSHLANVSTAVLGKVEELDFRP